MSQAVRVREPDAMHVAGLLLARILERAVRAGAGAERLPGSIGVEAGGMVVTIVPSAGGFEVAPGRVEPLAASLRAPLRTLLRVAGGGSMVGAVLGGGLRTGGSIRALLALRSLLLKAGEAPR